MGVWNISGRIEKWEHVSSKSVSMYYKILRIYLVRRVKKWEYGILVRG